MLIRLLLGAGAASLAVCLCSAARSEEPLPGAIVFALKYRGLNAGPNELRYNSYWGFGGSDSAQSGFAKAVAQKVKKPYFVHNFMLKGAEWSALELKDGRPVALYFDLNRNGKLDDGEKLLPARPRKEGAEDAYEFHTPDFLVQTEKGQEMPFRVLLHARFGGNASRPSCMWSPACVLEGSATIAGAPVKLILFANGFSGVFDQFGRCDYALLRPEEETGQYVPRNTLSSLVNHQDQFYRLAFQGRGPKGHPAQVVLTKDTTPTGSLAVGLPGAEGLKAAFRDLRLRGAKDETVYFSLRGGKAQLPAGEYRLDGGVVDYGAAKEDEWQVAFQRGPIARIPANDVCAVQLGKPALAIRAIKEENRYQNDAKEESVYERGAKIYLSPKLSGSQGESYTRFSEGDRRTDRPPQITIAQADGKEVVSMTMEYG
jgi:hypothetical protein